MLHMIAILGDRPEEKPFLSSVCFENCMPMIHCAVSHLDLIFSFYVPPRLFFLASWLWRNALNSTFPSLNMLPISLPHTSVLFQKAHLFSATFSWCTAYASLSNISQRTKCICLKTSEYVHITLYLVIFPLYPI